MYEIKIFFEKVNRYFCIKYLKRKLNIDKQTFYVFSLGFISGFQYITIGNYFSSMRGLRIEAIDHYKQYSYSPSIRIGNNVSLGDFCHIAAINSVSIGDGVLIGSNVLITDHQHGKDTDEMEMPPAQRQLYSKAEVVIEDNVWIGDNVVIMPGVRIGKGAVIAASAVVCHDVNAFETVGGIPARKIK